MNLCLELPRLPVIGSKPMYIVILKERGKNFKVVKSLVYMEHID
jgi:hypothetical protein